MGQIMAEQIFLNGARTVGFGDEQSEKKLYGTMIGVPFAGFLAGSVGGAILGSLVKKGVGTAIGTIAGGIGGAAAGVAIAYVYMRREPAAQSTAAQMRPGEAWTAVGLAHPIKPWTTASKSGVEDAVAAALSGVGLSVRDGKWSDDQAYTLNIIVFPVKPTTLPAQLPIASEWADQISFSNVSQAPVTPDWTL